MKSCHLAKPWGPKDFFTGVGYPKHNLEGYIPYPESLILPPKPPPTERTVEDQPFCLVQKHHDDHCELVDITLGSFSIPASQLKDHEALAGKQQRLLAMFCLEPNMCTTGQSSLRNLS